MPALPEDLFDEIVAYLSRHLQSSADREILKPVLSEWHGFDDIEWEGSPRVFSSRLVLRLPHDLLKRVLRRIPAGAEQREAVERVCSRIDAATGVRPARRPPAVRRKRPPESQVDGFRSLLFQPLDELSAPGTAPRPVEDIWAEWARSSSGYPLILIMDFPPDVPPTLLAADDDTGNTLWIDGEPLIAPADAAQEGADTVDLSASRPSTLVIDFSAAAPDRVLKSGERDFGEDLSLLLSLAKSRDHRVVLGLPRFVASRLSRETLRRLSPWTFVSGELFSPAYEPRVEDCEKKVLRRSVPFRDVLLPLLSANSATLARTSAEMIASLPVPRHPSESDRIAFLLGLSRRLLEAGYYEIAFRLEGYCRSLAQDKVFIPLTADLVADRKSSIVGLVESTAELPAMVRHGLLVGDTGSGKTTSLLKTEQLWLLPRWATSGMRFPAYLPLYVPLAKAGAFSLARQIGERLADGSFSRFDEGGERHRLACHALIGKLGTLEALCGLFGSPLMLLLDDADRLSPANEHRLTKDLDDLRNDYPGMGILLTGRDARMATRARLSVAEIRELNEQQVDLLLRQGHGHPSLLALMAANGKPISRYVRNPRLLRLICDLECTGEEVENANLRKVIELYVAGSGRRVVSDRRRRVTEKWLAKVALETKAAQEHHYRTDDPEEQGLISIGRALGLLNEVRDPGVLAFRFETLSDYFAARQLAKELTRSDVASILAGLLGGEDGEHGEHGEHGEGTVPATWRDVLRMVVSLLPNARAGELVDFLSRVDLRLAHECVLELAVQGSLLHDPTSPLLRSRMRETDDITAKVDDARTLRHLDPRIDVRTPLGNMVDVPGSELMEPFKIGQYPVTNMEFAEFVDRGYDTKRWWPDAGWDWAQQNKIRHPRYWRNNRLNQPNQPVTGVNFFEAVAYCAWLTERHQGYLFRLPSAAEWDRAAHGDVGVFEDILRITRDAFRLNAERRAGQRNASRIKRWKARRRPAHKELAAEPIELDRQQELDLSNELVSRTKGYMVRYRDQLEHGAVTPVGVFPANGLGCHDLFGNVWQWCGTAVSTVSSTETRLEDLPRAAHVGKGESIVVKGGSTTDPYNPVWLVMGGWFDPFVRFHRLGFRVAGARRMEEEEGSA
ncbi:SUMF1/EgtB/PvdO family nonheme iron enzyme [Nonomuraea helvata]|uniref:SUMF1/EgtB/PvdO family nonheme iron enzyme n=1 Tax=Nonomuraea helvata TaxID=37484 RepID=A0ABV5SA04_9ACTN